MSERQVLRNTLQHNMAVRRKSNAVLLCIERLHKDMRGIYPILYKYCRFPGGFVGIT